MRCITVAGIGVVGGQGVLRVMPVATMHRVSAVLLAVLSAAATWSAVRG